MGSDALKNLSSIGASFLTQKKWAFVAHWEYIEYYKKTKNKGVSKMTSQVVLLNAWGIGLASDSAVTSGNRVSNGSEKIFALPSPHKLAILTSSDARVMGYPWESVLSAWMETLQKPLPSIEDYWLSLEKWLCQSVTSTTYVTEAEFEYLESVIYHRLRANIIDHVWNPILRPFFEKSLSSEDLERANGQAPWDPEFRNRITAMIPKTLVKECMDSLIAYTNYRNSTFDAAQGISAGQSKVWLDRYFNSYPERFGKSFFEEFLIDMPIFPNIEEVLTSLAVSHITNPVWSGTMLSLVGFGEIDLLPSYVEVQILGFVGGVRIGGAHTASSPISTSQHLFYGQKDALDSLVLGRDTILMDATAKQNEALSNFRTQLSNNDDVAIVQIREAFENTIAKADLENEVINVGREQRLRPFQRAVQMSPVRDLAEFASTLVGVQAARAAFSQDNPTVGGPIDVATITRHEGFSWVRHK